MVKSQKIHIEFERLYSELRVKGFIAAARKRRKAKDGKNTVIASEFHQQLLDCCKTLYRKQKQNVYNIFNIPPNITDSNTNDDDFKDDDDDETVSVYPSDLLSLPEEADGDNDSTERDNKSSEYKEYTRPNESTSMSTTSSISLRHASSNHNRTRTRSRSRTGESTSRDRQFQHSDPREYSIRNEMNTRRRRRERRDRSHIRENTIQQIRNQGRSGHHNMVLESYYNDNSGSSTNLHHDNSYMLPTVVNVDVEGVNNSISSIPPLTYTEAFIFNDRSNGIIRDGCNFCGQFGINCHCNNYDEIEMSMIDDHDATTSISISNSEYARQCQQLRIENNELIRQRDECRRLLQQMQMMQNQHQQQFGNQYIQYHNIPTTIATAPTGLISGSVSYQQQSQPQYINFRNDITYFNALQPQLTFAQPNMIIDSNNINHDNNDLNMNTNNGNISSSPPFIDNNNEDNNHGDMIGDGDMDIPSLPNN